MVNYGTKEEHLIYYGNPDEPILIYNNSISGSGTNSSWTHADILANSSGTFLYNEMVEFKYYPNYTTKAKYRVLNVSQLSSTQALFTSQHKNYYRAIVEGG